MPELDNEEIFSQVKDRMIERGIVACELLLPGQKGTMIPFYKGSIQGFKRCKKLKTLKDFERALEKLRQKELKKETEYIKKKDDITLNEVWRLKGVRTQIEFVYGPLCFLFSP